MLTVWIIGVILNLILVYIWSRCYVSNNKNEIMHRVPVNILVAILFVITALLPFTNFITVIGFFIMFGCSSNYHYMEWRFPKWMTKEIK